MELQLDDVQRRLLEVYGIRVEPEMARYIMRRLSAGGSSKVPIIGGHAMTGTPMRTLIDPAGLAERSQPAAAPIPDSLFPQ